LFRRFSINFTIFSVGLDMALTCAALAFSAHLRSQLDFLPFAAEYPQFVPLPWVVFPIFAVEWVAILALFSVYDGRRNFSWKNEFANLTMGSLLAAMVVAGTLYLSFREISRLLYIFFVVLTYVAMLLWRLIVRAIKSLQNNPDRKRKVLIIGAGEVGLQFLDQIEAKPQLDLRVIGFLDNQNENTSSKISLLGTLNDLKGIVANNQPDDVVIALPQSLYVQINQVIVELHQYPVNVWLIPDYFRLALHKAAVEEFAGIPMLDLRAPALSDAQRLIKRAFDLTISILTLPFALPVMGVIALAIRLERPGEIILKQERMGENGKIFKMLKFRTMVPGVDNLVQINEKDDAGFFVHKSANDPRITKVGKFLRRMSLDELPQLFNVLKGQMSLVGPRPELPLLVSHYETWQRQRFAVPQGMTGWWQINGRSDRPMHLHTEDDLYYIQHYSLLLDIYILIKTFAVVIQGKGAF